MKNTTEATEPYYPEIVKENVRVEWDGSTNEGWNGEYDPEDPKDEHLLRFYVQRREGEEWVDYSDASYCTQFPAEASYEDKMKGLAIIMKEVFDTVSEGVSSVKKMCERLSWIGLDWLEDTKVCPACGMEYNVEDDAGHSCMEGRWGE